MPFWKWSKTAGSNATADPSINWAEGQSPSSINDSARAMMARTAEWRDDVSGTITTGGTSTAYTVTSNQGFDNASDMNGAMIAFVPHTTSGAVVTLNVDGIGTRPLRSSPSVELGSGTLIQGTPYVVTYNNSDGAFYLQGFVGNPFNIPIGGLMPYLGTSAPNSNFALPFGQAISRTGFSALFSLIGTAFGTGDGTTTFNLPDLRGRSVFGLGNMGGVDAGRVTVAGGNFDGTVLGAVGGAQNHTLISGEMPAHTHDVTPSGINQASGLSNPSVLSDTPTAVQVQTGPGGGFRAPISSDPLLASLPVTSASTGGGNPHTILSPCMMLPFILRVI